jgi:hypothetical protein
MKKRFLLLAAMLGVCACSLLSCRNKTHFSAGEALSETQVRALRDSLWEQATNGEASAPINTQGEKIYYYVAGNGTVYHSDPLCSHLKKSQNVQKGSLQQATEAGKERLCATCAKKEQNSDSVPEPGDVEQRICYYTAGGGVWHYDKACGALANSKDVLSGTTEQAMADGKLRPCARCGD